MTATITKKDLAYRIAERTGLKKVAVKDVLQQFIDEVIEELAKGNRLEFREFGVFEVKKRAARRARNPRTGAKVDVPEKTVIQFKAGRLMKEKVADRRSAAEKAASAQALTNAADRMAPPAAKPEAPSPAQRPAGFSPESRPTISFPEKEAGAET
jgi:integration host factor subunit beta